MLTHYDINKCAIDTYGKQLQIGMVIEECLELATELHKLRRADKDRDKIRENIIDEIADVSIMINQCRIMFGETEIDKRINFKMNKLRTKLGMKNA